jgi:hypothetical protein
VLEIRRPGLRHAPADCAQHPQQAQDGAYHV